MWRKSSYSGADAGNCLEVHDSYGPGVVPVRDSKNPDGPVLIFGDAAWAAFLAAVREGGAVSRSFPRPGTAVAAPAGRRPAPRPSPVARSAALAG
ncbi:hypothetical protein C3486_11790 [Streptomyces sp. Ru73]|uniref:DUF397 domain-containing protein n=1 Tax=Streptomyces sp. Ru73 TaxID=2080748 RepID=UPI000CDDAAB3|nr:DUF397 domain-containing protein [Streptomyces sp. Ru73]POX40866.1 hypothetical protein C3486_11790 [Streptomyces sp. Ru73]